MTDLQSLSMYLKEQDEKEYKAALSKEEIYLSCNRCNILKRQQMSFNEFLLNLCSNLVKANKNLNRMNYN